MSEQSLVSEIEAFLERSKLSATTFGLLAVNDGKFIPELKGGRRLWPETAERVRTFMRDYRPGNEGRTSEGVEVAAQ